MKSLSVGSVALTQTARDWAGNERRIREALKAARAQSISVVCLPELCVCGYGCEDGFSHLSTVRYSLDALKTSSRRRVSKRQRLQVCVRNAARLSQDTTKTEGIDFITWVDSFRVYCEERGLDTSEREFF